MPNISELKFTELCASLSIPYRRIKTSKNETPDYSIRIGDVVAYVEVKEYRVGKRLDADLAAPLTVAHSPCTDEWISNKITKACGQLADFTKETHPGLLLLYEAQFTSSIEGSDLRRGMYGDPSYAAKPLDPTSMHRVEVPKLSPERNRHLSALLRLRNEMNRFAVDVFHNHYAQVPFDTQLLNKSSIRHFRWSKNPSEYGGEWIQI